MEDVGVEFDILGKLLNRWKFLEVRKNEIR